MLRVQSFTPDANAFYGQLLDPTTHTPWGINDGWFSDCLNASNWFGPLVSGAELGRDANAALIGASDAQLRGWGYKATGVPSLDAKIDLAVRANFSPTPSPESRALEETVWSIRT